MVVSKEQKIAVLQAVQQDLLDQFKIAKSTETKVTAGARLKIENVKSELEKLHSGCTKLIEWYSMVKKN